MDATLQKILELMEKNGIDNLKLAEQLGLNRQAITDWKAGRSNSYKKYLYQIADYFGVTVDYLKGETDKKAPTLSESFTEEEKHIIYAYRKHPDMHEAVHRLLGINTDNSIISISASIAAKGEATIQKGKKKPQITP